MNTAGLNTPQGARYVELTNMGNDGPARNTRSRIGNTIDVDSSPASNTRSQRNLAGLSVEEVVTSSGRRGRGAPPRELRGVVVNLQNRFPPENRDAGNQHSLLNRALVVGGIVIGAIVTGLAASGFFQQHIGEGGDSADLANML
jgi:hypothetical protein